MSKRKTSEALGAEASRKKSRNDTDVLTGATAPHSGECRDLDDPESLASGDSAMPTSSSARKPSKKRSRTEKVAEQAARDEEEDGNAGSSLVVNPTGRMRAAKAESAGDGTGDVGIIMAVQLKNFMCHSRLDFKFSPNVNIIVGRNGSGKSAVMSAITVGLGSRANVTNRGTSLKTFIKHGKQSAEVVIKMRNRGPDAHKSDLYGDTIIVERIIRADGSTQYKLKSHEGKVVSIKREDLVNILDHFNIQVENPVAMLNQDTSKNFLHSKNAADKYKFFLKATQLEQMKSEYTYINEQKELTRHTVTQKDANLPDVEQEVRQWEQKFKALENIDELKLKVSKLNDEMAWAIVNEKEQALEPIIKSLKQEEARIPKFEKKVTESQVSIENCTKKKKVPTATLR